MINKNLIKKAGNIAEKICAKYSDKEIKFKIPIIGVGCGVLGMTLAEHSIHLGKYASKLLKALEYRGYDSTGAIFQDDKKNTTLLKDVGAPSTLVETLGIKEKAGKIFCGQVRWATFGAVDKKNSQPHEVKCKTHIYGAHNGNITNTRELKTFLISEGHDVLSDNDGEMLVHTVEHYFEIELRNYSSKQSSDFAIRSECMKKAITKAINKTTGSFAAVITDPVTEYQYAIKAGSSLYFGVGEIDGNKFSLASSDLTAVLRFTKYLVNLREGEFVEYTADFYKIYAYKDARIKRLNQKDIIYKKGQKIFRDAVRSKLRAEDTELLPKYNYFMDQEIDNETESTGKLVKIFLGGSNTGRRMLNLIDKINLMEYMKDLDKKIKQSETFDEQLQHFNEFINSEESSVFYKSIQEDYKTIYDVVVYEDFEKKYFFSSEMNTYIELIGSHFDKKRFLTAKALDSITEKLDVTEFDTKIENFMELLSNTNDNERNIYTIACGTSFNATKVAAVFFNEIAGIKIIPILPGDFRGQYSNSLRNNDVIIGVSQSGETKDLIDIFNDIDNLGKNIKKIVLVNNMNSTLGQEKSDVSIPILCGPEIAVPATKSFVNQLTLFYYLAIKAAEMKMDHMKKNGKSEEMINAFARDIDRRYKKLLQIPLLIKETIETTKDKIDEIANKIYMEPSMHILATKLSGVAKEGALKIRETVLNHTEGGEASEFKHGPNTILGKNTVFGLLSIKSMLKYFNKTIDTLERNADLYDLSQEDTQEIIKVLSSYIFTRTFPFNLSPAATRVFKDIIRRYDFFNPLYRNYPLLYVTGPEDRDVNLTISQINTHKIRGADTYVIAEENDKLMENASLNPDSSKYYGWGYIPLPKTGDSLLTSFSSTVVLQRLALRMSIRKMEYLDKLSVEDHGVHPDVPKNVSKSITVD